MLILMVGGCLYSHIPSFWAIPTTYLGSVAAASAIGFINMTGNMGGFGGAGDRWRRGGGGGLCHGARQDCHFPVHCCGVDCHDWAAGQATKR